MTEETRAVRVARRRKEQLDDYWTQFEKFINEELSATVIPQTNLEKFQNAVCKLDAYINRLCISKPQETSFYQSVAFEWQRQQMDRLEKFKKVKDEIKTKGILP